MNVGDGQKYGKKSTAAQLGVTKPHTVYSRGLWEYRCTGSTGKCCYREDGGSWFSVKRDPACAIESSVKNHRADAGGGEWWRVEAQTTTTSGETVKQQGVVNNKKGS